MKRSWAETERFVRLRAGDRCEYCRMHQSLQGATIHIEHIIPRSAGGSDQADNLAWACPACNLKKSNRVVVPEEETGSPIALFNPRCDEWSDHFTWDGYTVLGLTAIGRALIAALDRNNSRRQLIRECEGAFGLFRLTRD
jgi:hypothetical protein